MTNSLIHTLEIEQLESHLFRGHTRIPSPRGITFGGQVIAQSIIAANNTVGEDRSIHSLHAYFLQPGDPAIPIEFSVEPMRDGQSFSVRQVVASQNRKRIFSCLASFHVTEGGLHHQAQDAGIEILPEHFQPITDFWASVEPDDPQISIHRFESHFPFELRSSDWSRNKNSEVNPSTRSIFLRLKKKLPGQLPLHQAMLAHFSDYGLLPTIIDSHPIHAFQQDTQLFSLDHAMWFHAPIDINEWILYRTESPWAGNGRGLANGAFFNMKGQLVATTRQEGLVRVQPEVL